MDPDLFTTIVQFILSLSSAIIISIVGLSIYRRDPHYILNCWFSIACWFVSLGYFALGLGLLPYLSESGNSDPFFSVITFEINLICLCFALSFFIAVGLSLISGVYWLEGIRKLLWVIPSVLAVILFVLDTPFDGKGVYGDLIIAEGSISGNIIYLMIGILLFILVVTFFRAYWITKHNTILYMSLGFLVAGSSVIFSLLASLIDIRFLDNVALVLITIGILIVYLGFRLQSSKSEN